MPGAVWLAAVAPKTIVAPAAAPTAVRAVIGAKTVAAPSKRAWKAATPAKRIAEKGCFKRESHMCFHCLSGAMARKRFWIGWNKMKRQAWFMTTMASGAIMMILKTQNPSFASYRHSCALHELVKSSAGRWCRLWPPRRWGTSDLPRAQGHGWHRRDDRYHGRFQAITSEFAEKGRKFSTLAFVLQSIHSINRENSTP